MSEATKTCLSCKKDKPLSEFYRRARRPDGRQPNCSVCQRSVAKAWRDAHPLYHRERLKRDPQYFRRSKLRRLYGIALEDFDAMLGHQHGLCAICGRPERRGIKDSLAPLVVDHDHRSGRVRGLLCHSCNVSLAVVESPEFIAAAQAYLARSRA